MPAQVSELCARCKLKKPLVAETKIGNVCELCLDRMERGGSRCSECGAPGEWKCAHPEDPNLGNICNSCALRFRAEFGTCPLCRGEEKRLSHQNDLHGKICSTCYLNSFATGICTRCQHDKPLPSYHPDDSQDLPERRRVCRDCYKALIYGLGRCPCCNNIRELKYLDPRADSNQIRLGSVVRICAGCYHELEKMGVCSKCSEWAVLCYIHPEDKDKPVISAEKRHVCRKCYDQLSGSRLARVPTLGLCPLCPEKRRNTVRDLRETLEIEGVPTKVCRQCFQHQTLLGICSFCSREMVLWKVHPADRILMPDDLQRRVCMACFAKLSKNIRNLA